MSKLILHIGGHKTGTTTVQRIFANNRALLAKYDVIYPDIGPNDGHHVLAAPWMTIAGAESFSPQLAKASWLDLAKKYGPTDKTVFLSAEPFSRALPQSVDFNELALMVEKFDDVQIVYVTREQCSYCQSIWLQVAKTTTPPPWKNFVRRAVENKTASGLALNHNNVLNRIRKGFDLSQVTLVDYAQLVTRPDGILGFFTQICSEALNSVKLGHPDGDVFNASLDPLASWIATAIDPHHKVDPELTLMVRQLLDEEFGGDCKTTLYSKKELKEMKAVFNGPNRKLEKTVQSTCPDLHIRETDFPDDLIGREALNSQFWGKLGRKIYQA